MSPPLPPRGSSLSDREVEVVRLVAQGLTNTAIGRRLYLEPVTVKTHLARISSKLGVSGRGAIVAAAFECGLLRLPDAVVVAQAEEIRLRAQERYVAQVRADLARQVNMWGAA